MRRSTARDRHDRSHVLCYLVLALVLGLPPQQSHAHATVDAHAFKDGLCGDVAGTLDTIGAAFTRHGIPFLQSNDTAHEEEEKEEVDERAASSQQVISLLPVVRMMQAFGCMDPEPHNDPLLPATKTLHPQLQPQLQPPQSQPPPPRAPVIRSRHRREVLTSASSSVNECRVRGSCKLATVLDGTCLGPTVNGTLTITFAHDEAEIDTTSGPSAVRALQFVSGNTTSLTITGRVGSVTLQWLLDNGVWTAVRDLTVEGLQFTELQLSMFNPFSSMDTLRVVNSESLTISAQGADIAEQLLVLSLRNISLPSLPTDTFARMTALLQLDLSLNRLSHLDKRLFAPLTALQQLFLDHNRLQRIPAGVLNTLTALRVLIHEQNDISVVDAGAFQGLTRLLLLDLTDNPVATLPPHVFDGLTALRQLELDDLRLQRLPQRAFAHTTQLRLLRINNNDLTAFDEDVFWGLSQMLDLRFHNNRFTRMPPRLFRDLSQVDTMILRDNRLKSLPAHLLDACVSLKDFRCQNNQLTSVPPGLFRHMTMLRVVFLSGNQLQSVDGLFDNMTALTGLVLDGNNIAHFRTPIPSLSILRLRNNPMRELPHLEDFPVLDELRLSQHLIPVLDLSILTRHTPLHILQLDADPRVHSTAIVHPAQTSSGNSGSGNSGSDAVPPPSELTSLHLQHVDIRNLVQNLRRGRVFNIDRLHLGWSDMDETTVDTAALCHILADNVIDFALSNTRYAAITLCPNKTFDSVLLQDNKHVAAVSIPGSVRALNMSGCNALTSLDAPLVEVLDVSETRVTPSAAICTRWGRRVLFARNLLLQRGLGNLPPVLFRCLQTVDVIDLSGNPWLDMPSVVNSVAGEIVALSHRSLSISGIFVRTRTNPPVLQLQNTPIECAIRFGNELLRVNGQKFAVSTEVVYNYDCTCARGFKMTSGGRCVVDNPDVAGVAAGSVIGGLFFGLFVAWLSRRYRGLTKRIDLQEQLLVARDEEVMALKKAWEIEYDELRMIKRVAAGAFGVVFKAEWDTVTVAVKVMQESLMLLDDTMVVEFEKEVEFLQKTRHPNVVRFFGAGTDPNGSPFLVLEFVALGSLRDLLGKDMEQVLREVKNRKFEESGAGRDDVNSVWDLKLRLLRDVASGMAFIHSLDQMHRDLKSGNVLVSSSLRAKITDFGSIRQCFTRDRNQRHTRLSSTSSDDPRYSQQAGLQTMTSMTLTAGVGTPLYMAPEALVGDKYSFEADVFSFGVLMWEVAMQRVPDLIEQEKGSGYRGPILATLKSLMDQGIRLKFDDTDGAIPLWFKALARDCMDQHPRGRPSFKRLSDVRLKEQP
ncbi:TKL protein kinase [Salpingoeca rosetta]|uniref:TKL protein kinase n=1 Tax=Salpingoeca rosetta (strain ATCC 50818 / BSB-021) TaxID=946362 RepID=F2UR24_SALR5|nr:TKL protein kinase [Salpingoeca rosetta]EGD80079.1 TKL protein kinase [Salpingoeca rosetta]|eukprot:XP_004988404.1 TKL protein kinase [Salpingoeca rosetta]